MLKRDILKHSMLIKESQSSWSGEAYHFSFKQKIIVSLAYDRGKLVPTRDTLAHDWCLLTVNKSYKLGRFSQIEDQAHIVDIIEEDVIQALHIEHTVNAQARFDLQKSQIHELVTTGRMLGSLGSWKKFIDKLEKEDRSTYQKWSLPKANWKHYTSMVKINTIDEEK